MFKERLNIMLYDESSEAGGGAGEWNLNIDPAALEQAAADYVSAVQNYKDAKADIIGKFNAIANESSWQDVSNTDYIDKIKKIVDRLDAIETTLINNSTNLNSIASFAKQTESNVHTSINQIN